MEKLFTRFGTEYTGPVARTAKGAAYFTENRPCSRCGGAGGADQWKHTGWKCFRCGGACVDPAGPFTVKLYTSDKLAKLNATKAKADAKRAATAQATADKAKAEADARRADFIAAHGALIARAEKFASRSEFIADVLRRAVERCEFVGKQADAITSAMDKMDAANAMRAASGHVGKLGERIEIPVTVERVYSFERGVFNAPWINETCHIITMRDVAGNAIVAKGTRFYAEAGEAFTLRATVKDHGEYKGEKQTTVQRAKRKE